MTVSLLQTTAASQALLLAPAAQSRSPGSRDAPVSFDKINYMEALVFPFQQKNWPQKMWWLPLVSFIPMFSFVIMRGWRLDITRRRGQHAELLPDVNQIGRFFAEGVLLWIITSLYWLPQIVLLALFGFSQLDTILTIGSWFLEKIFTDNEIVSFGSLMVSIGTTAIVQFSLPALYYVISYPIYRMGMVRYALTGRVSAFFDPFTNIKLCRKHIFLVMTIFLFDFITTVLFVSLSTLLASTIVGIILVPAILLPALYWTNGYIFGVLAENLSGHDLVHA